MSSNVDELVGYFGFGSLVNPATLRTSYIKTIPATLKGWRRHWQDRDKIFENDVALLSIHRDETCSVLGMMVIDRLENLPQVDEREEGYSRVRLQAADLDFQEVFSPPDDLFVYVANEVSDAAGQGVLLQSYMDAVLQGFLSAYGEEGITHFVETTNGFERAVISDRTKPLYPRSVDLGGEEQQLIDRALATTGIGPFINVSQIST